MFYDWWDTWSCYDDADGKLKVNLKIWHHAPNVMAQQISAILD